MRAFSFEASPRSNDRRSVGRERSCRTGRGRRTSSETLGREGRPFPGRGPNPLRTYLVELILGREAQLGVDGALERLDNSVGIHDLSEPQREGQRPPRTLADSLLPPLATQEPFTGLRQPNCREDESLRLQRATPTHPRSPFSRRRYIGRHIAVRKETVRELLAEVEDRSSLHGDRRLRLSLSLFQCS